MDAWRFLKARLGSFEVVARFREDEHTGQQKRSLRILESLVTLDRSTIAGMFLFAVAENTTGELRDAQLTEVPAECRQGQTFLRVLMRAWVETHPRLTLTSFHHIFTYSNHIH